MNGDPTELLERTIGALGAMDTAQLERLQAAAEAAPPLTPAAALRCAPRAGELRQSLHDLLRSTEASMRVLRRVRTQEQAGDQPWEH